MTDLGKAQVVRADARNLPLPDASADLIVTSPPYFGLRDYQDGDESLAGQIGAETTPAEFVAALLDCTREWMRVLKPEGSLWINLGDSYYSGKGSPGKTTIDAKCEARTARRTGGNPLDGPSFGVGRKSLIGLPWRYALGCIDELGLILRAEVIWSKPNGLPESVTDRVRRSHEQWFHFTKQPRYFSSVDEIREPHTAVGRVAGKNAFSGRNLNHERTATGNYDGPGPLGKLPGSVWEVATQPLNAPEHLGVDHFAAFPSSWPMRIIAGWSPQSLCTGCGQGRRPVSERLRVADRAGRVQGRERDALLGGHGEDGRAGNRFTTSVTINGYGCLCADASAPSTPALVVDPFGGTGTTALAARALGRDAISFDLSADYCRLANWRINDPGELARVLGDRKPIKPTTGQIGLFGEAS